MKFIKFLFYLYILKFFFFMFVNKNNNFYFVKKGVLDINTILIPINYLYSKSSLNWKI